MKKIFLALVFAVFSSSTFAADLTIEMLNKNPETKKRMVYSTEVAKIDAGQSIEWVPTDKGHNVEMLAGPSGYELPKKTKMNKPVTMTFTVPGIYLYQCSPHAAMGMIGLIVVGGDTSNLDAINSAKVSVCKSKKKRDKLLGSL